jgi:hypothetical protein
MFSISTVFRGIFLGFHSGAGIGLVSCLGLYSHEVRHMIFGESQATLAQIKLNTTNGNVPMPELELEPAPLLVVAKNFLSDTQGLNDADCLVQTPQRLGMFQMQSYGRKVAKRTNLHMCSDNSHSHSGSP